MPKFFVHNNQLQENNIKIIGEDVKHISSVLRMKIGDEITVCHLETNLNYLAKITAMEKEAIICSILDCQKPFAESNIKVTIFQGLPKADKMEYIIQKATELGAIQIVPVSMKRSIVKLEGQTANQKVQRWQKIAETASKQSGRDIIPEVKTIQTVKEVCPMLSKYDKVLLAYENEQKISLKQELQTIQAGEKEITIGMIIGPEGGFDCMEVESFMQAGARPVSLGKRILRTETASVTMISNIMYEYEM